MPGRKVGGPYRKKTWKVSRYSAARKTGKSKGFKSKYNRVTRYNPRGSIFGKQYFAKLKYQTVVDLSVSSSVMTNWTFVVNSLYDPDNTGAGGQPLFFDTLVGATNGTQPFLYYRVCGCKAKVTFMNDNSSGTSVGIAFIHWRYGGAGPLDTVSEVGEQPNTICRDLGVVANPKGILPFKTYISMKKMLGVKDIKDDEDTVGVYDSSPAKLVYLDVGYQPYTALVDTTVFCRVKLTFYCQFFGQTELLQS